MSTGHEKHYAYSKLYVDLCLNFALNFALLFKDYNGPKSANYEITRNVHVYLTSIHSAVH